MTRQNWSENFRGCERITFFVNGLPLCVELEENLIVMIKYFVEISKTRDLKVYAIKTNIKVLEGE